MTSLLLIIIAIILFFIAKALYKQADNNSSARSFHTQTPTIRNSVEERRSVAPSQPTLSYWLKWKQDFPARASIIEETFHDDISNMPDAEAKQVVDAYSRMANANNISDWSIIKPTMLNKLTEMVDALGETTAFTILDKAIQEEIEHTQSKKVNTGTYIAREWLKEAIKAANQKQKNFSSASTKVSMCSYLTTPKVIDRAYTDEEKNQIANQFKDEYIDQIMNKIGDNIRVPLFCNGYDSPIAREIMHIMYSYLRDEQFVQKAKQEGLWNKLFFLIIEETNKITDKICDCDVQECIEYYNFPNKPVVTSRRCPSCGSRRVFCEEIGDYECMECGCVWHARHGRDTYTDY